MKFIKKEWYGKKVQEAIRVISREEEERCAIRLANRVQAQVPVRTGRLRASVKKYQSKKGPDWGYTVFVGETPPGMEVRAQAMPRRMRYWNRYAYYALWVERGTKDRFQESGRYTGRVKGKRFMRKAINIEKAFFI